MMTLPNRISNLSAISRMVISFAISMEALLALQGRVSLGTQLITTWNIFALTTLALAWVIIVTTPSPEIRKRVQRQDVAGPWVTMAVIAVASAALLAVVFLLRSDKDAPPSHIAAHVVLTLLAVVSSWALLHTVFSLHYAHTFYGDGEGSKTTAGGLEFPGNSKPDYIDFAYFSFVIGMTFQVSDVQITARNLRQLALIHSVISFGFNTAIIAFAVNTVTSLH